MAAGSIARTARRALVTLLDTRLGGGASVEYSAPVDALALTTSAGVHDAIWTAYDDADLEVVVLGGTPYRIDETVRLVVVVQVLRTDGTDQDTVDERGEELLRDVLAVIAANPDLGVVDADGVNVLHAIPTGWEVDAEDNGVVGGDPSTRGARFRIAVEVEARLELT